VPQPPVTPRRAFLYSLLLPGYGQAALDRPNVGALFVGVEVLSLAMASKSAADLREARRFARDTIIDYYTTNTETGALTAVPARNRFQGNTVRARRTHYEDWVATLIFNHLISGADAFVAAQLWDLPAQVTLRVAPGSAALVASVPLR
jgi:hypothetical protein